MKVMLQNRWYSKAALNALTVSLNIKKETSTYRATDDAVHCDVLRPIQTTN